MSLYKGFIHTFAEITLGLFKKTIVYSILIFFL